MGKMYKKELEPEPVPRSVIGFPVVDEEDVNSPSCPEDHGPSLGTCGYVLKFNS